MSKIVWAVYAVASHEGREIVRLYESADEAEAFKKQAEDYKKLEPTPPNLDDCYDDKWNVYCDAYHEWSGNHIHLEWTQCDYYEVEAITLIEARPLTKGLHP